MDIIDVKILEELQANARISLSDLSKRVNLSLSAVSERMRKLNASGIIKDYTTILNPQALGKELFVFMSISLETMDHAQALLDFVAREDEILECYDVTDSFDYIMKIVTRNTDSLDRILQDIKSLVRIKRTQVNIILSTSKHRYSVAPTIMNQRSASGFGGRS